MNKIELEISGFFEFFSSDDNSDFPHSIIGISALNSTLDPTEPIVDSSPFSIELAADAVSQYDHEIRLSDCFSRDPITIGVLAENYLPNDLYMYIKSPTDDDGQLCIGTTTYNAGFDHREDDISVVEVYEADSPAPQYIDSELGVAPEVTVYPRVWKGRRALVYLDGSIWRICYLTENPRFTAGAVVLTMAPIDARIRDHHIGALMPRTARFADKGRDYILSGKKTKHLFFWSSGHGPAYSLPQLSGASTYTLTSGTYEYTGLINTIQNTTTVPAGGALLPALQTAHRIFTPCAPSIGKISGGVSRWGISGRSSSTIYFDVALTTGSNGLSFYCDPALRVLVGDGLGTGADQLASRFGTATYSDPLVAVNVGAPTNAPSVTVSAYQRTSASYGPSLHIGFIWRQTEANAEQLPEAGELFADRIIDQWANGVRACASCADSEAGLESLMQNCDVYSLKPLTAPDASVVRSQNVLNWVKPITDHAASYEIAPNAAINIAQSDQFWIPGESNICLTRQFVAAGNTVWLDVRWTEDGETFIERKIDLIYRDEPVPGVFRYDIGANLARQNAAGTITFAGIGDWFGNRATFTADPTIAALNDSDLLLLYFTSDKLGASLYIPIGDVDRTSFAQNGGTLNLISEWRFEGADALDDNLGALLTLSSTAVSFGFPPLAGGEYRLMRRWIGPLTRDEAPVAIGEEELLEIPTAELEDHIIADYSITFADDKTVTYSDSIAKSIFNAEKTFELDLSLCPLNQQMSPRALAQAMRGTLASLVDRFGAEIMSYRLRVPFELGKKVAPGDSVTLTCSRVVGAGGSAPPNQLECRVFDVEQDVMGQTTSLRVIAHDHRVARYQRGCRILSGLNTITVVVDDASWVTAGMQLYYGTGSLVTVNSKSGNTLTLSASVGYSTVLWQAQQALRFINSTDRLG